MFGINGGELLVLLLIVVLVVGPQRLPEFAEQLGGWVRQARSFVAATKARVTEELGEEGADVDWASLDPRRYDPRRIVRDALLDDGPIGASATGAASAVAGRAASAGGTDGPRVRQAPRPAGGTADAVDATTGPSRPFPPYDPDLT